MLRFIQLIKTIQRAKREGRTDELLQSLKAQQQVQKKNHEIQKIMLRPMRYETINGAGEIGWGTFLLCCSLASYISSGGSWMWPWRVGISCLLMLAACFAMPLSRWAIKKYVTWPRTGYVAYRRDGKFWMAIVVSMVVAVGVSIGLSRLLRPEIIQLAQSQTRQPGPTSPGTMSHPLRIILAGMGPLNALMYLMINAVSIREHRWKWLLLVVIALGPIGIWFLLPGNYIEVSRPVMLCLGLVWLISGGLTLDSYLQHTATPALPAQ